MKVVRYLSALVALMIVTGSASAVPNYLTFSGTVHPTPYKNASIDFFGDFSNSISGGSTYHFVFTYDTDTITPDITDGTATVGTASYISSFSLVSGSVGSFTDFSGWSISKAEFGSGTTFRGTQDYFQIWLNDGSRTALFGVNYGHDGETFDGQNAWDSPFPMPTIEELNTEPLVINAQFDERGYNGNPIFHIWQGEGADDGSGFTATQAPEPTAALVFAPMALLAMARRRR